jgi:DNA polymerase III alpha subunit
LHSPCRCPQFASLFAFVQRTGLTREATENLVRVGAFDGFGLNQRELIWQLGLFWGGMQQATLSKAQDRQLRLPLATEQDQVRLTDFSDSQLMTADYAVLSLSPDGHPMQFPRGRLGEGIASSQHLRAMPRARTWRWPDSWSAASDRSRRGASSSCARGRVRHGQRARH